MLDPTTRPILDRRAAKARLLARFRDESIQPAGYVAMRCSDHGAFILWVSPPAPPCRVACPPACSPRGAR